MSAQHNWVTALDNLSYVPAWCSDALCRLATGAGFATRTLYTDSGETVLTACRPIVLNGITDVVTRSDLLDRSLVVHLPRIGSGVRRTEREFWCAFNEARPEILGGLFDAVSYALGHPPETDANRETPRLADTVEWVSRAEPVLGWVRGTFLAAYRANQESIHHSVVEGSPVASAVVSLLERSESWDGTADQLLPALAVFAPSGATRQRGWPRASNHLVRHLRRLAPNLRGAGIEVEFEQDRGLQFQEADQAAQERLTYRRHRRVRRRSGELGPCWRRWRRWRRWKGRTLLMARHMDGVAAPRPGAHRSLAPRVTVVPRSGEKDSRSVDLGKYET